MVHLIGFALVAKNIGDRCISIPRLDSVNYIDLPHPTGLSCYVSSFNPDHPEQSNSYNNHTTSMDYVTASGTVASGASLSLRFDR
jgi:hypothetical protein